MLAEDRQQLKIPVQIHIPVYTRTGRPLEAAHLLWKLLRLIIQLELDIVPNPDGCCLPLCILLGPGCGTRLHEALFEMAQYLDVDEIQVTYPADNDPGRWKGVDG